MNSSKLIGALIIAVLGVVVLFGAFHWLVNRIYVPEGKSLMLRYKGPLLFSAEKAPPDQFAKEGQIGILEELRGPGRHFYCPIWWERELVDDQVVEPGHVAIVKSNMGDPLPEGEFLVDGDLDGKDRAQYKGTLRKVFGPGRYRVHPYAFEFQIVKVEEIQSGKQTKYAGWVEIPTGYVGVVTNLADNPLTNATAGIQKNVLPPGIYPTNPREQQIDIVEIGYRETSITVTKQQAGRGRVAHDDSGEPLAVSGTGIQFPSNDGYSIQLDFTAIWGVMPEQAPFVVEDVGGVAQAENNIIAPQSDSICRNTGSKMSAVDLLVGETRQQFQSEISTEFQNLLKDKNLTLLYGLVRHIYIPQDIRLPIQNQFIAQEMKLTREQETITAKAEANLRKAEKTVELEKERTKVETEKMVAETIAEGEKQVKEIAAETKKLVAEIDLQIAEMEAKKTVLIGEAQAKANQLQEEAKAQKFQLAVEAFGTGDAFNKWQFAQDLPESIDLRLLYAGEGTLWTDLKNVTPTLPIKSQPNAPANRQSR